MRLPADTAGPVVVNGGSEREVGNRGEEKR